MVRLSSAFPAVIRLPAKRRRRLAVAWLLTLGFMFQPFLAYLVTPMVGHDAHGQRVVEQCTLMGSKKLAGLAALETGHDHAMHGAQSGLPETAGPTSHDDHAGAGHEQHASSGPALDLTATAPETPDDTEHCPALTLFKMAGSVQILMPPSIVTLAPGSFALFIPVKDRLHPAVEFTDYLTRAPPSLS